MYKQSKLLFANFFTFKFKFTDTKPLAGIFKLFFLIHTHHEYHQ